VDHFLEKMRNLGNFWKKLGIIKIFGNFGEFLEKIGKILKFRKILEFFGIIEKKEENKEAIDLFQPVAQIGAAIGSVFAIIIEKTKDQLFPIIEPKKLLTAPAASFKIHRRSFRQETKRFARHPLQ